MLLWVLRCTSCVICIAIERRVEEVKVDVPGTVLCAATRFAVTQDSRT
jgi:hypothetical protein